MTGGEIFLFTCCLFAVYRVLAERSKKRAILEEHRKLGEHYKDLLDTAMAVEAHNVFLQIELEQIKRRMK